MHGLRLQCGYGCSDHASWTKYGYPSVMPFESLLGQDSPVIHSSSDTVTQTGFSWAHSLEYAKVRILLLIAHHQFAYASFHPSLVLRTSTSSPYERPATPVLHIALVVFCNMFVLWIKYPAGYIISVVLVTPSSGHRPLFKGSLTETEEPKRSSVDDRNDNHFPPLLK